MSKVEDYGKATDPISGKSQEFLSLETWTSSILGWVVLVGSFLAAAAVWGYLGKLVGGVAAFPGLSSIGGFFGGHPAVPAAGGTSTAAGPTFYV